jgi:hypothetical protein
VPFRLTIEGQCSTQLETLKAQAACCDLPRIGKQQPHGIPLAVCGGAPSLVQSLNVLKGWMGKVWGVNHTSQWLTENGVPNTFFTVDSDPFRARGVTDALVASTVHRDLIDSFGNVRVRAFDLWVTHQHGVLEGGILGGSTSVLHAPCVALRLGYTDVSFFGCDGSFEGSDHVDRDESPQETFIVRAGGRDYQTTLPLMTQTEELARLITTFPDFYHNRSEGLLKAVLAHPDTWAVVGVSPKLKQHLIEVNGDLGLFDAEYVPA